MLPLVKTAQDTFKALLDEDIALLLKGEGFRRRDSTFRRQRNGAWQIVNFQRSQFSDSRSIPLAVNLAVALPELDAAERRWQKRGWPLEYECDFRARLGVLVKGEDHWWTLTPLKPVRPTARAIAGAIEEVGLPWLDLHSDARRLLRAAVADPASVYFMNLPSFHGLAWALGDREAIEVAERELARWDRGDR